MISRLCKCGGRIRDGKCSRCTPEENRKSSHERGYTKRWAKAADRFKRQHPHCVCCLAKGRVTVVRGRRGTLVDHIVPVSVAPELFWDQSNWQTLCHACDGRHKKPFEQRCIKESQSAREIRMGWSKVLEGLKMTDDELIDRFWSELK